MDLDALYHCVCGEWHYKNESIPPCTREVTITLTEPQYTNLSTLLTILVQSDLNIQVLFQLINKHHNLLTLTQVQKLHSVVCATKKEKVRSNHGQRYRVRKKDEGV